MTFFKLPLKKNHLEKPAKQTNVSYYQAAKSWYQENYESVVCSRNRYRLSTISLGVLLAITLITMSVMLPLKSYYYRILTINHQTGEVAVLKEIEGNNYTTNWTMTHFFLNQYVQARESYSFEDIKRKFNNVIAMSEGEISDKYIAEMIDTNPQSPINTLKKDYYREVEVFGIDKLNDQTALARFKVITYNRSDINDKKEKDWHAIIRWKYTNEKTSLETRDKNPLGFKVTYYQLEPVFTDK